jgi:type IV secretory pathway TraG/TraD family ATPase VirD4
MEDLVLILGGWILIAAITNTTGTGIPGPATVVVVMVRFIYWLLNSPFDLLDSSSRNQLLGSWDQRSVLRTGSSGKFTGIVVDGRRRMSEKSSHRHTLVVGPTGSGKSSAIFLINLLSTPRYSSFFVYDPKSELWAKSSGYLASIGFRVLRLVPGQLEQSVRFNPLKRALVSDKEIRRLSEILVPSDAKGEAFWVDGARQLLFILVKVLSYQEDTTMHCLPVLRQLINQLGNIDQMTKLVWLTGDTRLISEWDGMSRSVDSKVMGAWISHLRVSTDFLLDEEAAELVAADNMDFGSFRHRPTVLFLNVGERNLQVYKSIIALLLAQFIDEAMRNPAVEHDASARSLCFLLDEFGVFASQMKSLPETLSMARSFRCSFLLGAQSLSQINDAFGSERARSLLENLVTEIYLAGITDPQTLTLLEQRLGNTDHDSGGFVSSRPLMSASEIRAMKDHHALVFHANKQGFITKTKPYFLQPKLRRRAKKKPIAEIFLSERTGIPFLNLHNLVTTPEEDSGEESLADFLSAAGEEGER